MASDAADDVAVRVPVADVLASLPELAVLDDVAERLGADTPARRASAAELALEALYLAKRIDKTTGEGETVYG